MTSQVSSRSSKLPYLVLYGLYFYDRPGEQQQQYRLFPVQIIRQHVGWYQQHAAVQ
jgi:hypothetical protein